MVTPSPDTDDRTEEEPTREAPPGTPRWVKIFGLIALLLVLLFIGLRLFGGGGHGPGQHTSSVNTIAATAVHGQLPALQAPDTGDVDGLKLLTGYGPAGRHSVASIHDRAEGNVGLWSQSAVPLSATGNAPLELGR